MIIVLGKRAIAIQVQNSGLLFWMCLPLKFLLLQKSTHNRHTNIMLCSSRKTPYVWPFSQSSQKTDPCLLKTGHQCRAHVFLRMHKDDVQNALMKNALDVSCSSLLYYQLSRLKSVQKGLRFCFKDHFIVSFAFFDFEN